MAKTVRCSKCKQYVMAEDVKVFSPFFKLCASCRASPVTVAKKRSKPKRDLVDPGVREAVLKRDHHRCRFCGVPHVRLHVHHIVYLSSGGPSIEQNLVSLDALCHQIVHSDKRRYQPLLLGVVRLTYQGVRLTVPQFERRLSNE